jgi:NADH-quinone oxidoreductase subunit J
MSDIQWESVFFLIFGGIACAFSLAVVFTPNVVRMAFYLVISLAATAGLFFLAGADFVGAMQIMIYVGGTLVLLIFGVMLTAQSPFVSMKTRAGEWILAALVGGSLLAVLLPTAFSVKEWRETTSSESVAPSTATRIGMGLLGARVDKLDEPAEKREDSPGYLLPFEIISIHLLVVLVGAAYLARPKRRRDRETT